MSDKTGGPAFPNAPVTNANGEVQWGTVGMSLRDFFAAKAMQGLLASDAGINDEGNGDPVTGLMAWSNERGLRGMARRAYALADAMLAERDK